MAEPEILLASRSPRRRALLRQIGVRYRTVAVAVDEARQPGEAPEQHVVRLAAAKAAAGRAHSPGLPVLGADTVVVIDGDVLGKPQGKDEALAMLARLSARSHRVLSAVAAAVAGAEPALRLSTSTVWFRPFSAREREAYWRTGEPRDKAGAYAVQGLAATFVTRLDGSYSGVMGLPLFETAELLRGCGVEIFHEPAGRHSSLCPRRPERR